MSLCEWCGKQFDCGMQDTPSDAPCWCTQLPALPSSLLSTTSPACYCPTCLAQLVAQAASEQ